MPPCMSAVCAGLPGSGGHHLSICKRRTISRCANGFKREYRFGSWIGTCRRFGNLTLDVGTWDFKSKGLVGHSLRVTRLTSRSPRRIRRREVEMHVQMRSQKIANHLTLVRRQIVQNDVGLSRRPRSTTSMRNSTNSWLVGYYVALVEWRRPSHYLAPP